MYSDVSEKALCAAQANMQAQYIRPTRRKQLQDHRAMLTAQLDIVDKALTALDAHPELEEFAEALSRAGV